MSLEQTTGQSTTPELNNKKQRGLFHSPPLLLYSYIANELLAPFFASFLILYGVFFLIRLIPLLDVVLSLQIGPADFIRLFAYIFPHMLLYIIPMASMAGVIVGFTRLTNDREILALKACGISLRQMLPPVILIAAAIASLTGYFSIRLIPVGEIGFQQLMFQLALEKIDNGIRAHEYTEALGDIVLYVDHIDANKQWHGVYVSDMRGRTQPIITLAKRGHMQADMEHLRVTIILEDGSLYNQDGQDNQVVRFGRYQLQIGLQAPTKVGNENMTHRSRGMLSQEQLLQAASKMNPNSPDYKQYIIEYHHRLVLPVGCFILSLLGLPLGLQAAPGRRAVGLPLGLGFFILYYITYTTAGMMAEEGSLPLVPAMWLTNGLFFVMTVAIIYRVNQERSLLPEWLQHWCALCWERTIVPILRRPWQFISRIFTGAKR